MITFETKRRLVMSCLVLLSIWPLVQIFLVHSTGLSPWRGFGWGMYSAPVLEIEVGIHVLEGRTSKPSATAEQEAIEAVRQFIKRYQALGHNVVPHQVARAMFQAYPGYESIVIDVSQNRLDRDSAHIVGYRASHFKYHRDQGGKVMN